MMEPQETATSIEPATPPEPVGRLRCAWGWVLKLFACLAPAFFGGLVWYLGAAMDKVVRIYAIEDFIPSKQLLCSPLATANWPNVGKGAWLAARITWSYASTAYVVACIAAICVCAMLVWSVMREPRFRRRPGVNRLYALLGGLLAIAFIVLVSKSHIFPDPANLTWRLMSVSGAADEVLWSDMLLRAATLGIGQASPLPESYERGFAILGIVASGTLVFAACILLVPAVTPDIPDEPPARRAADLARLTQDLRMVLYTGMLVLVFSVFQLAGLYSWINARVAVTAAVQETAERDAQSASNTKLATNGGRNAPAVNDTGTTDGGGAAKPVRGPGPEVEALTQALLNFRAMNAALMLAALYFPASAILMNRARELARRKLGLPGREMAGAEGQIDQWLRKQGLAFDLRSLLPKFAAIIAPILAGLASHLPSVLQALVQ